MKIKLCFLASEAFSNRLRHQNEQFQYLK